MSAAGAAGAREKATLAGGCFWCLEAVYTRVEGVHGVTSGYAGGDTPNPSYREVCDGRTGHAEVVQVEFDPSVIGYREILEIFFAIHDPTTLDRQGNDVGAQYRSAIFTHDPRQREEAERMIANLTREQLFDDPIVTTVEPLTVFWPAEQDHHRYFDRNPEQPYCQYVVAPKVAKLRRGFAHRLREG